MSNSIGRGAESNAADDVYASTDHFWYRPQPDGLFVDSQRGNKAFAFTDDEVLLSEDNGRTWPHRIAFPDARKMRFSCILGNGNILFGPPTQLFLSTDDLRSYKPITVKDLDGSDYVPHTPKNPEFPGWYFHSLTGINTWEIDGVEMLVWGNFANVIEGAAPINIYYSTDHGQTVKIAYSFGQNPRFRDDGTRGSKTEGTLLGNPDNPVICRHIHSFAYNPVENAFYACTGDFRTDAGVKECHWLRGTYDMPKDEWDWQVIVSGGANSRYKSGGINFVDGKVYWVADANGPDKPHDCGVFCCDPADLPNKEAHTKLLDPGIELFVMMIDDGMILVPHGTPKSPLDTGFFVSPDMGKTWAEYDLKEFGERSPVRFHPKNSDGWLRVDLRAGWITPAEMMFIKPKRAPGNGGK